MNVGRNLTPGSVIAAFLYPPHPTPCNPTPTPDTHFPVPCTLHPTTLPLHGRDPKVRESRPPYIGVVTPLSRGRDSFNKAVWDAGAASGGGIAPLDAPDPLRVLHGHRARALHQVCPPAPLPQTMFPTACMGYSRPRTRCSEAAWFAVLVISPKSGACPLQGYLTYKKAQSPGTLP